jgi:CBS domain-containing protein
MPTEKTISQFMSASPVVGNKSSKFSQILRLFTEFPLHHLPIVDDDNKLIGILSSNDLPKVFLSLCNSVTPVPMTLEMIDFKISVTDLMTPNPVVVASTDPISSAVSLFEQHKFASLPVVDNGILVGIITSKDVMTYLHHHA